MRKLRLREVKPLAQVHSAGQWQGQGSDPAPLDYRACHRVPGKLRTLGPSVVDRTCIPNSLLPREPDYCSGKSHMAIALGKLAPPQLGVAVWLSHSFPTPYR